MSDDYRLLDGILQRQQQQTDFLDNLHQQSRASHQAFIEQQAGIAALWVAMSAYEAHRDSKAASAAANGTIPQARDPRIAKLAFSLGSYLILLFIFITVLSMLGILPAVVATAALAFYLFRKL